MELFSASPAVVYLTNQKAFYQRGKQKGSVNFDRQDFDGLFKQLSENLKSSRIRIILGNDLGYLLTLTVPKTAKPEEILIKASELIPEEVTSANSVISLHGQDGTDNNVAQVFVIANSMLSGIAQASTKSNIEVDYLCPVLSVITASLEEKTKAVLYLYLSQEETVATIIKQGVIYGAQNINQNRDAAIEELTDYVKGHFGFKAEETYTNADPKTNAANSEVKHSTVDPYAFVESHQVTEKPVSNFITLRPIHKKEKEAVAPRTDQSAAAQPETKPTNQEVTPENVDIQEKKSTSSIITAVILIIVIVGALGFFVYQYFILNLKK